MPWTCHAQPVALNGQACLHRNTRGIRHGRLICCESCGCTKIASDDRRARKISRLSLAQVRMLDSVKRYADPYNHVRGQAAHGGAAGTIKSLLALELLVYPTKPAQRWTLTREGHIALRGRRA